MVKELLILDMHGLYFHSPCNCTYQAFTTIRVVLHYMYINPVLAHTIDSSIRQKKQLYHCFDKTCMDVVILGQRQNV